jgi:hypothetical protein
MSEIKITIEGTPNPHALKFVLDRQVQLTGSSTYVTAEEAQGIPMASKLMALPGVETVFFMDSFVTVSKDAATPWQPLTDNVERVIRESIDQHDPAIIPQKVTPQSTSSDVKLMQIEEVIDRDIRPGLAMDGGVLVVGPSDNTVIASVLPAARKTLLPCDECAHTLNNDHSMTPETLIVTTGQDNSMYQVRTVKQVGDYYLRPDNDDEAMLTVSSLSYPEALERAELYLSLYAEETHKDAASRRPLAQLAHLSLLAKL